MMRYPDECGKKWRIEKQTKLGWKKQKEQEEVKMIERIMEEKENKEEDLIELRTTDEIVPRWFHKVSIII